MSDNTVVMRAFIDRTFLRMTDRGNAGAWSTIGLSAQEGAELHPRIVKESRSVTRWCRMPPVRVRMRG